MLVSFISDLAPHFKVFQCSTVGVPFFRKNKKGQMRQVGSTTDHTDRYFVQGEPGTRLVPCKPVDLGTAKRKGLDGKPETYHRWTYQITQPVKKGEAA